MSNDEWRLDGLEDVQDMSGEFGGELGDPRRTARAKKLGAILAQRPGESLPNIMSTGELEGAYRLLNNEHVSWRDMLQPHVQGTRKRVVEQEGGDVLVVHDTTDMTLPIYWPDRRRRHLVPTTSRSQGMLLHESLAVSASGESLPLGTLAIQPYVHQADVDKCDEETRQYWHEEGGLFLNEHQRWFDGVERSEHALSDIDHKPIHVMDREGDSYGILSAMQMRGYRFVVRVNTGNRKLTSRKGQRTVCRLEQTLGERFPLRDAQRVASHPPRKRRQATLEVMAATVQLNRARDRAKASWSPDAWEQQPESIELNLVELQEVNCPAGDTPVRWVLLTNTPIDTDEQVLHVVDWYRRRWVVEEFFGALKSGCKLEERQMGSAPALLRMVSMLLPVAWRLLRIRSLAQEKPGASWRIILTPLEFELLRAKSKDVKLGPDAPLQECQLAIARLGGHLRRNGRPGWKTLHRGWRELQIMVDGAMLALRLAQAELPSMGGKA